MDPAMLDGVLLNDRAVLEISGPDAVSFLHNLVTNDIAALGVGEARFAALLTPQGKILCDFLVHLADAGAAPRLLLDCPKPCVADLSLRLRRYKLRARIEVQERHDDRCYALSSSPKHPCVAAAPDPRRADLGWRVIAEMGQLTTTGEREAYEARRIAAGVPDGLADFVYGDTYPHEANMDRLTGIDFKKGCYVGQEVVARMQYRTTVKKRVTPFAVSGPVPAAGTKIHVGSLEIGVVGSSAAGQGLALVRLDRLAEARLDGTPPEAAGVRLAFAAMD